MGEEIAENQISMSGWCNPYNITMDAYNHYFELSNYGSSNTP